MTDNPSPSLCSLCNSSVGFTSTRVNIDSGIIYRCNVCDGFFLYPPTKVEYTNSEWSDAREQQWEKNVRLACQMVQPIKDKIEQSLDHPIENVLEIGCGSGFMGEAFQSIGCNYTGTEVDTASIDFARSKGVNALNIQAENMPDSKLATQKFDLILSSNVFEHFNNPILSFQNLHLLSSGIIVIIVPNALGLYQRLRANSLARNVFHSVLGNRQERAYTIDGCWHNIAYTIDTLKYMCEHSNLTPLKIAPMSINDPIFGFVQPNWSLKYRAAASLASLVKMDSELLLIAKPK